MPNSNILKLKKVLDKLIYFTFSANVPGNLKKQMAMVSYMEKDTQYTPKYRWNFKVYTATVEHILQ